MTHYIGAAAVAGQSRPMEMNRGGFADDHPGGGTFFDFNIGTGSSTRAKRVVVAIGISANYTYANHINNMTIKGVSATRVVSNGGGGNGWDNSKHTGIWYADVPAGTTSAYVAVNTNYNSWFSWLWSWEIIHGKGDVTATDTYGPQAGGNSGLMTVNTSSNCGIIANISGDDGNRVVNETTGVFHRDTFNWDLGNSSDASGACADYYRPPVATPHTIRFGFSGSSLENGICAVFT